MGESKKYSGNGKHIAFQLVFIIIIKIDYVNGGNEQES
jgi:hypothetical protein